MNRRDFIASASTLPLAGAALASVQVEPTPVQKLYREWKAKWDWIEGEGSRGMPEDEFNEYCDNLNEIEDRIRNTPSETVSDILAKITAVTGFGSYALDDNQGDPVFWTEVEQALTV